MDKNFEALRHTVDYTLAGTSRPGKLKSADAVLNVWAELHGEGVSPQDFAETLLLISGYVVTCHDTMPAMLKFAERMQSVAEDKLRILRETWPDLPADDASQWPKGLHPDKD